MQRIIALESTNRRMRRTHITITAIVGVVFVSAAAFQVAGKFDVQDQLRIIDSKNKTAGVTLLADKTETNVIGGHLVVEKNLHIDGKLTVDGTINGSTHRIWKAGHTKIRVRGAYGAAAVRTGALPRDATVVVSPRLQNGGDISNPNPRNKGGVGPLFCAFWRLHANGLEIGVHDINDNAHNVDIEVDYLIVIP